MMDMQKLIYAVQVHGYNIVLNGDIIKLVFSGKGNPPREATPGINAIRENKEVVITYLKNVSQMDTIFTDAVQEISKVYQSLTIGYVVKLFPRMYEKSVDAETKINKVWDEGKDIKAFREAVGEWKDIHLKFTRLLNAKKGVDDNRGKVYNPSNRKPDPSQGLGKEIG